MLRKLTNLSAHWPNAFSFHKQLLASITLDRIFRTFHYSLIMVSIIRKQSNRVIYLHGCDPVQETILQTPKFHQC